MRRSFIWTTLGQIILFASQMASQILVARHLTPYLMGVSAIAFSISDFVNLMQTFGLRNFLVREASLDDKMIASTFTINLIMSLATSSLVVGIAFLGSSIYHEPRVGDVLLVVAMIPVVMSLELIPGGLLQRNMQFGALAAVSSAKAIVAATTSATMIFLHASYMSISYGALAGALVSTGLTCFLGRRHLHWRLDLSQWRRVTTFGLHMLSVGGVANVAVRSVDLIVGRVLGLASLGLFSRASALNNVLWSNIHLVFTKVVFSRMADEMRATGSIRDIYLKTVNLVTAVLWPAFAGLAVFGGPVVYMMYGPKWVGAGPILSVFAVAAMGLTATTMSWEVFVVCSRTGEQARIESVRSIILIAAISVLSQFGAIIAACCRIVDAMAAFLLYRTKINEMTEVVNRELFAIYGRNLLLTLSTIAPAVALMQWWRWQPNVPFYQMLLAALAGVIIWAAMSRILNKVLAAEIGSITSRLPFNRLYKAL